MFTSFLQAKKEGYKEDLSKRNLYKRHYSSS